MVSQRSVCISFSDAVLETDRLQDFPLFQYVVLLMFNHVRMDELWRNFSNAPSPFHMLSWVH